MDKVYELDGEKYKRKNGKWLSSTNCSVPTAIEYELNSKYPLIKRKKNKEINVKEKKDALDHRVPGSFWSH